MRRIGVSGSVQATENGICLTAGVRYTSYLLER